uniref:RING-type E3 ubiquitin transferase n=1 Tax=Kalanchoe fedtschenkoi TaxID=63787 RepID=A0A7N0ZYB3_KALFE
MSTDRDSVAAGGGGGPKQYFCYQCDGVVTITVNPSSSADLVCPTCAGGFLEEYENPNPNPPNSQHQPSSFFSFSSSGNHSSSSSADWSQFPPGLPFMFGDDGHGDEPFNSADITAALFGLAGGGGGASLGGQNRSGYAEADVFNPIMFLQNYLNNLRAGGANIQFVIENNGGGGVEAGFRLPSNLGDYFIGPGLEQLIQQLAENDPNRYGTPPASKKAVKELPDIKVSDELLASDNAQCAVCMDTFELGGKAKQMPCKHIYHPDCILPWLELHNSCPVCRYELPTDDPEYEQHSAGGQRGIAGARVAAGSVHSVSAAGSGGASEENSQSRGERMFRVQLPWPFNSFGSGSDGSNSGSSHNDNENSGGRSHQ